MNTIQSSCSQLPQFHPHPRSKQKIHTKIIAQRIQLDSIPIPHPSLSYKNLIEELTIRNGTIYPTTGKYAGKSSDSIADAKFYAIIEAVEDRVEMHKNIGKQRDNWNHLLLSSVTAISLSAAVFAGIASAASFNGAPILALKMSSTLLYTAATGILTIMNKIQPSQLAEEQRNASRLFKQLQSEFQTKMCVGKINKNDVNEAMEKVLALDKAYPLPLLGGMLEKFPSLIKPAMWWPEKKQRFPGENPKLEGNGWNLKLEEEMKQISEIIRKRDIPEYLKLGERALKLNKILAISGPVLTALGAVGSVFIGRSPAATMVGVMAGAAAAVVSCIEHGGQIGMVFEMYRSNAGFFKLVEESIEGNVGERDVGRRENGEVFEVKLALQLGRSVKELRRLSSSEFGSKLF